jgi:DNA invertase Pin-like site-specific DNA recombinase
LIGVQDKRLQDIDRDLAIIVGVLGWAAETGREFIGQRAGEALFSLKAQGRRIGRPPSEQAGRKIVDLVAGGDPLKDARGSWAWLPHDATPLVKGSR